MLSLSVIVLPDENSPSILNIWISAYQTTRNQDLKIFCFVCAEYVEPDLKYSLGELY